MSPFLCLLNVAPFQLSLDSFRQHSTRKHEKNDTSSPTLSRECTRTSIQTERTDKTIEVADAQQMHGGTLPLPGDAGVPLGAFEVLRVTTVI